MLGSLCSGLGPVANAGGEQMGGDGSCPPAAPRLGGEGGVRWRNQQPPRGASGKTDAAFSGNMVSLMGDQNQNGRTL